MVPRRVLFLCSDCVTSAPVLETLRTSGYRLHVAHSVQEAALLDRQPVDVIVIMNQRHANAWISRLKLLGSKAPVVLLCSGPEPLAAMPPPVDAVCHIDLPNSFLKAVSAAVASSLVPVQLLQAQSTVRHELG